MKWWIFGKEAPRTFETCIADVYSFLEKYKSLRTELGEYLKVNTDNFTYEDEKSNKNLEVIKAEFDKKNSEEIDRHAKEVEILVGERVSLEGAMKLATKIVDFAEK